MPGGVHQSQILDIVFNQDALNFPPGDEFSYSNSGYSLLAEIVARTSGKSFKEFMRPEVFEPLGMNSTHIHDDSRHIVESRADSYEVSESGGYQKKILNFSNMGATSLMSSLSDMANWAANFEEHRIGSAALYEEFNRPSKLNDGSDVVYRMIGNEALLYANGQMKWSYRGKIIYSHGGHDAGFRVWFARFPELGHTFVTISNDEHYNILQQGMELVNLSIPDALNPPPERQAEKPPIVTAQKIKSPVDLRGFSGTFTNEALRTQYEVTVEGEDVILYHNRHGSIPLVPQDGDTFRGSIHFPVKLVFQRDSEGRANRFVVTNFGTRNVVFTKRGY